MGEEQPAYFLVVHVHEFDDGSEDFKMIGLYRTEESANAAVERARLQPGFRDVPDGFDVTPYELDVDGWTEGYVTVQPDED